MIAFMAGHWMGEPRRFVLIAVLMLASTACDLSIPWATRGLIDAVATPPRPPTRPGSPGPACRPCTWPSTACAAACSACPTATIRGSWRGW
uniref:Uncharacterized protein n=1 Tax=Phenylobacterium glaciei TaxID=2803784 RepID=A0A974P2N3_9CAUL|nr:hypothetical protein JKL49_24525 [Phenylobacterium glaciei]